MTPCARMKPDRHHRTCSALPCAERCCLRLPICLEMPQTNRRRHFRLLVLRRHPKLRPWSYRFVAIRPHSGPPAVPPAPLVLHLHRLQTHTGPRHDRRCIESRSPTRSAHHPPPVYSANRHAHPHLTRLILPSGGSRWRCATAPPPFSASTCVFAVTLGSTDAPGTAAAKYGPENSRVAAYPFRFPCPY